ncbi:MAG: ABC transporter ATP-binding protein [Armatimonadetes bacterium]|nr:ABC transporter ATP-binding protein [Armatimonadota bacterium]
MSQVLLAVDRASKIYRMGEVEVPALREVSLAVMEGEFLMIRGPSGSGKSTLLNLLGGMDRPTSGSVRFLDQELSRASDRELTFYRRRQVGFVFQFFNLIPTLTALENVQVAVEIVDKPMDAAEALRIVGLERRASHFPSQLSGGEQQRVAIARALASNPRLLLCDEPTGNLDSETSKQVLGLLLDVNQRLGKTVIVITHHRAMTAVAHRVAEIRDGVIVAVHTNEHPVAAAEVEW